MLSSTAVFLKLSLVVLLMVTVMATNNVPQSMSDVAQSAHDEVCFSYICFENFLFNLEYVSFLLAASKFCSCSSSSYG